MSEHCPDCDLAFESVPRDCPKCGFRIREHKLREKVKMLESARIGWKREAIRLKDQIAEEILSR
jgi:hypothetical protein